MSGTRLVDITRQVVTTVHPEELPDFDRIVQVYREDPRALELARTTVDEPTASGVTAAAEFFTSLVLDVGVDVCAGLITSGAISVAKRSRRMFGRRANPGLTPETELPPITEAQAAELAPAARAAALQRGASAPDADAIGRILTEQWTRR